MTNPARRSPDRSHASQIQDQFSRQAEGFAASPSLHNEDALSAAGRRRRARAGRHLARRRLRTGLGRRSICRACPPRRRPRCHRGDARAGAQAGGGQERSRMPNSIAATSTRCRSRTASFDIVSCRFAFHHFEEPKRAFAEMMRVCRRGGRIVLCDGLASDDPAKAAAFNRMELHRDPSTVEFRTLGYLVGLFAAAGLPPPSQSVLSGAGRTRAADRRIVPGRTMTATCCVR